jgi:hypothetical protein
MKMKKGGVKSPYPEKDPDNTKKDDWREHQKLVDAERGESKLGKENTQSEQTKATATTKIDVGGSRRRRKTRKSRKTRKIRRRR